MTFIKLRGNQQIIFVNPSHIVHIALEKDSAIITCTENNSIKIHFGRDMPKNEFMDAIAPVTNLYTINEQNSSIG